MIAVFFGVVSCIFFILIISRQKKIEDALKNRDLEIAEKIDKLLGANNLQ